MSTIRAWLEGSNYDGPPDHEDDGIGGLHRRSMEWVAIRAYEEHPEWEKIEVESDGCVVTLRRSLFEQYKPRHADAKLDMTYIGFNEQGFPSMALSGRLVDDLSALLKLYSLRPVCHPHGWEFEVIQ